MALKFRVLSGVSRAQGSNGISASLANGIYTIEPSFDDQDAIASIAAGDRDNLYALIYNSDDGTYKRVSMDVLLSTVSSGLDATLVAIANLSPGADQSIYFSGSDTAALYTFTSGGRALVGLTGAADRLPYFTGSGTASLATFTAFGRTLAALADASAGRSALGLVIGTDVQAQDAELAALAGLTSAADKVPYFTGSGTAGTADFTAAGRSMVGAANAAAQTALLSVMVGDSGAGGTKGLVPAAGAGDAAASKFLRADGTWFQPVPGGGDVVGPGSSTNNGFVRFNGTTGKLVKDSAATIVNADVNASAAIDSAKLSFLSAGTGASAQSLQNVLRSQYLNLKNFGAVGDGVTDDTAAIQAALDAVQAGSYGGLYAPAGTYITGGINWPGNNITLMGEGSGYVYNSSSTPRTIFKAKLGTTTVFNLVQTTPATGIDRSGNHLVDIGIDGNFIAANGIALIGVANVLERVNVRNCTEAGVLLDDFTNDVRIVRCGFIQNWGYGLVCRGSSTTTFSVSESNISLNTLGGIYLQAGNGVTFSKCVVESNAGPGLLIYKPNTHTGAFYGISFDGCWFEDNASTGALYVINISAQTQDVNHSPSRILFRNCHITSSYAARKYLFIGCVNFLEFDSCDFGASTQSDAMFFGPNARFVSIHNHSYAPLIDTLTAAQVDSAVATGYRCWWSDPNIRRVVNAGAPAAAFTNLWTNYGVPFSTAKYWFDHDGNVHLEGGIKSGTLTTAAFTLPAGYRPTKTLCFGVDSNGAHGLLYVQADGQVIPYSGSNVLFSLDGVVFPTG